MCSPGGELAAQTVCPEGRVTAIFIDNHDIFDPATLPEAGRLRWAYRLANSLHLATRERFIARELLFREGDCLEPADVQESARILRQYRFIARADVFSIRQPDGTQHVVVDTRDEWSTKLTAHVRVEDQLQFDGVSAFEENFLGRGIALGLFAVDRDAQRDLGVSLELPHVSRLGLDTRFVANRTRVGTGFEEAVVYPFDEEAGATAFRQSVSHRDDLFAYALSEDPEFSHVTVPLEVDAFEVSGAKRFGEPGGLFLVGGGLSYEHVVVDGSDGIEGVRNEDFSAREGVGAEYTDPVVAQLDSREALRLNVFLGIRRLRFETRRGFDAVDGVQDLPVGSEVLFSMGRTIGGGGGVRPGDLFSQIELLRGGVGSRQVHVLTMSVEGRLEDPLPGAARTWRDVLLEGHGFFYLGGAGPRRQTLVLRGSVHAGWRATSPFQLTLGGPDGVRGYTEHELPGGRRAVISIEDRIRVSFLPDLVDLGVTLFGDVGQVWSGGAPFGIDSGWRGALGAGVRWGFPPGSSTVIRADVAFPLGPEASSRRPVFRITAGELLGVLNEFRSVQLQRARRSGIRGRYIGVARERAVW